MYSNTYNDVAFLLEGKGNTRAGDFLGSPELPGIFFWGYHKELCLCQELDSSLPVLSRAQSRLSVWVFRGGWRRRKGSASGGWQ